MNRFFATLVSSFLLVMPAMATDGVGTTPALTPYFAKSNSPQDGRPRVLVFSKMAGYVHRMTPDDVLSISALGERNGLAVDATNEPDVFTDDGLKPYRVLIFVNCSGNLFTPEQQQALVRYIHAGGGFVGIHAASTAEPNWPWYRDLVGARFSHHPWVQTGTLTVTPDAASQGLPASWTRQDEWYVFDHEPEGVQPLIQVSETRWHGDGIVEKGTHAGAIPPVGSPPAIIAPHPIAWCHEFEDGRAFYTAMGHFAEAYVEPEMQTHLITAIRWAGKLAAPAPYRVLVLTKCTPHPYVDKAIPAVSQGLVALGTSNGFTADIDAEGSKFTPEGLKPYQVIVLLNACGAKLLDDSQRAAMQSFVRAGGGVVGIHAAAYTARDWPWLGALLGGVLDTDKHFEPQTVRVVDAHHPASASLPASFTHQDQWFRFKTTPHDVHVLMTVDGTKLTDLGINDPAYPVAWYHDFEGGRAFYTTFGHESKLTDPVFANQILGAISWAKGK